MGHNTCNTPGVQELGTIQSMNSSLLLVLGLGIEWPDVNTIYGYRVGLQFYSLETSIIV